MVSHISKSYHIIIISYHPIENIIHIIYFHMIYNTDIHPYMIDTAYLSRTLSSLQARRPRRRGRWLVAQLPTHGAPFGLVVLKGTGMGHQFAPRNCENWCTFIGGSTNWKITWRNEPFPQFLTISVSNIVTISVVFFFGAAEWHFAMIPEVSCIFVFNTCCSSWTTETAPRRPCTKWMSWWFEKCKNGVARTFILPFFGATSINGDTFLIWVVGLEYWDPVVTSQTKQPGCTNAEVFLEWCSFHSTMGRPLANCCVHILHWTNVLLKWCLFRGHVNFQVGTY